MRPNHQNRGCITLLNVMAILALLIMLFLLISCKEVDRETVAHTRAYTIEKIKVDSTQYLLVTTGNGVAIIKHQPKILKPCNTN